MATHMSELDALMWDLEAHDPALRPVITVVVVLDGRPDPAMLAARLDRMSRRVPRLRDRVVSGPLATAPPRWEPDPEFDVTNHLVDAGVLAGPPGPAGGLRLAETLGPTPFPPGRPPWQVHMAALPADFEPGPEVAVAVIRLHHAYTDGMGAMRIAGELFDADRRPPAPMPPPPLPPAPHPPLLGRLVDDLAFEASSTLRMGRSVGSWAAAAMIDALLDPEPRAGQTLDLGRHVQQMGRVARSAGSPLLAARSARSLFEAIELPLAEMRAVGASAGGTVNDVFLAGILGGLRLYHAKHGEQPPSLRIGIPASTRGEDGAELRNQFLPLVVRAPLQLADPAERVRLVHALVVAARRRPALEAFEPAVGFLRRLPGGIRVLAGLLDSVDLMASNVPGSPIELYLAGARVERMIPFGPRGGAGLNLTLISHHHSVHIGVNSDAESLADQDVLVDCLRRGFDETLACS